MSENFVSGGRQMTGCAGYSLGRGANEFRRFFVNGGKGKGMVHLTERRTWRTRRVHTAEYWGKMEICHTLIRVNTI